MSQRKLRKKEIDDILKEIHIPYNIPISTKDAMISTHKEKIKKQLTGVKIYAKMIPELKKEIILQFNRTLAQGGESVGIIAAQSIGERQTQSTLDTFHSAGLSVETVITGVPRFTELLNATHDPKSVMRTLYLKDDVDSISDIRRIIRDNVVYLEIKDIMRSFKINKDHTEEWYENFELIYGDDYKMFDKCISVKFDIDKMFEYKLCLKKISKILDNIKEGINCVFSPSWENQIDIFISDEIFEEIDEFIPLIKSIKIAGIDDITSINYRKEKEEWCIVTHGSGNFNELLNLDFIDKYRISSNNMWDVYKMFGIEATRQFLIDEFIRVVSSDGTYINKRHVMIMVDIMTHKGNIISISRYGIDRKEAGVFSKASFEESLDNFLKAALFTDREETSAISSSIICGKEPRIGTGICSVMMDLDSLEGK